MDKSMYAMRGVVAKACICVLCGRGSYFCRFGVYLLIEWPQRIFHGFGLGWQNRYLHLGTYCKHQLNSYCLPFTVGMNMPPFL